LGISLQSLYQIVTQWSVVCGRYQKTSKKNRRESNGELRFLPDFPTLASRCNDIGKPCFSDDLLTNSFERRCIGIGLALPTSFPGHQTGNDIEKSTGKTGK
jgi:hypothetical protein